MISTPAEGLCRQTRQRAAQQASLCRPCCRPVRSQGPTPGPHDYLGDRLTGHHGLLILGKEAHDLARCACLHLVERLHDLDETNRVVLRDRVAIGFVGWFVRRWLAGEYAREGRKDSLYSHEFLVPWSLWPWPAPPQRAAR